jgi:hypothetical protein
MDDLYAQFQADLASVASAPVAETAAAPVGNGHGTTVHSRPPTTAPPHVLKPPAQVQALRACILSTTSFYDQSVARA